MEFNSARSAFKYYLTSQNLESQITVFIPAYIGWSSIEGSGVFDPIKDSNVKYEFYALDTELGIIKNDLFVKINNAPANSILLLIHYFGRPDPNLGMIVKMAKEKNIRIVEDAAHALFSSLIGGSCGGLGDVSIYSLHKMLPIETGGILQINNNETKEINRMVENSYLRSLLSYDLSALAQIRKNNEIYLRDLLLPLHGEVDLLWPELTPNNVYLQTLPVLIKKKSRNDFYFELNKQGFGVVSLYHTMINEINPNHYPESFSLSKCILNLPLHQESKQEDLKDMVNLMINLIN
ncbi:hypothetical protein A3844_06000 [Paenibacillus helianthi]|uniref:DegT/DnrJ/EryC1/StrS aminotransferase family protein n=1 Tax=Paenibacillus helianthi TaxID=1349432 RepID=A0ABX3ERZ2_9BACL|nr:hypothetical protein A3844_06000 [Paenibacillus helianthi]